MHVLVGTSGFAYSEWKGSFYPDDLPKKKMLSFYASKLSSVEINNTFYRFPDESVLVGWSGETPKNFQFVLKAPQQITHRAKLDNCKEAVETFFARSAILGTKLGPALFQLPPFLKKDVPRLEKFLAMIPKGKRIAIEFRHASWFDDETFAALRAHGAALCWAETDELLTPAVSTSAFGYLRLRTVNYDDASLRAWAAKMAAQAWGEAFVFFKHEDTGTGPQFAAQLSKILGETRPT